MAFNTNVMGRGGKKLFFYSSGVLLILTAFAKLWSAMGNERILAVHDELLLISNRELMLAVSLTELVVAFLLFRAKSPVLAAAVLFWLSANFGLYRVGMLLTVSTVCPCLGTVYARLGLRPGVFDAALVLLIVYFLLGSSLLLWEERNLLIGRENNGAKRATLLKTCLATLWPK